MEYDESKDYVDKLVKKYLLDTTDKLDPRLVSGLEYILEGGKRLRAVITLAILQKLQSIDWEKFAQVCLVPEFIHTASLIIDDLPAFDNGETRRGKACIHRVKGEGLAYLTSITLVTEALLLLHKNLQKLKEKYGELEAFHQYEEQINKLIINVSGSHALEGQLLSTYHTSGDVNISDISATNGNLLVKLSKEEIQKILYKKTASFFQIALIVGWTVGNGDLVQLPKLERLGELLGLCYQIYDDFLDYHHDVNDTAHFSHNYIYHRGLDTSYTDFEKYSKELNQLIAELNLECEVFYYIQSFMYNSISNEMIKLKTNI